MRLKYFVSRWPPVGPLEPLWTSYFLSKVLWELTTRNSQQRSLVVSIINQDHTVIEMEFHQPRPISFWVVALLSGMGWNVWVKVKLGRDERPKIARVKSLEMNWRFRTWMAHLVSVRCYRETGIHWGGRCTPLGAAMGQPSSVAGEELLSGQAIGRVLLRTSGLQILSHSLAPSFFPLVGLLKTIFSY